MISDNLKECLQILDFDDVPTMAELRTRFLKLCIERHPDKGGEKDKFQKLLEAKQVISEYINNHVPEDETDSQEVVARRIFREFNEVQLNTNSITVKYPSNIMIWCCLRDMKPLRTNKALEIEIGGRGADF